MNKKHPSSEDLDKALKDHNENCINLIARLKDLMEWINKVINTIYENSLRLVSRNKKIKK